MKPLPGKYDEKKKKKEAAYVDVRFLLQTKNKGKLTLETMRDNQANGGTK